MEQPKRVYAVIFGNYEPAEVVALYDNREAADAHADHLDDGWGGGWRVVEWSVATEYRPEQP